MPGAPKRGTPLTSAQEVARAGLVKYSPTHLHVEVVVGAVTEWKPPIPPPYDNAYVDRPSSIGNVEAYVIVIKAQAQVVAADWSTWQGLEGIIFPGVYQGKSMKETVIPERGIRNDLEAERKVPIPPSLLEAAGIGQLSTFYTVHTVPISLERALSAHDLTYVRANCLR